MVDTSNLGTWNGQLSSVWTVWTALRSTVLGHLSSQVARVHGARAQETVLWEDRAAGATKLTIQDEPKGITLKYQALGGIKMV